MNFSSMEALFSTSFMSNMDWFHQENQNTYWTKEENKRFEHALAIYGDDVPDRWIKVAEMIPGKTVLDVIKQYRELEEDVSDIEAGRIPIPGYPTSSFTLELVDNHDFDGYRKRPNGAKGHDHERKKGVPWTEDEHRRFLMGLVKYGKGDWRNISRNFVVSKTPTQVASHAQKYYQRQLSGGKDKRRPSIHDITVLNLTSTTTFSDHRLHRRSTRLLKICMVMLIMELISNTKGTKKPCWDDYDIHSLKPNPTRPRIETRPDTFEAKIDDYL
ncbi:hypothetical protein V6Z12_A10G267000 [Gossypium hirsutum]